MALHIYRNVLLGDSLADRPAGGERGVRFIAVDTGSEYVWNGAAWTQLASGGGGGGGGSLTVKRAGVTVGTRGTLHFTDGADITTTITDDSGNGEVDVQIGITPGAFTTVQQQAAAPTGASDELWIDVDDPRRVFYRHDGVGWRELLLPIERIGVALSDETTTITAGAGKAVIHMPFAMTVTAVRAEVNTVSSSGLVTVDINEGAGAGTSILSTKLSIDANEETSVTAATPAVISDALLADNARITFDIDAAGTGAKGLKVWIIGYRTT